MVFHHVQQPSHEHVWHTQTWRQRRVRLSLWIICYLLNLFESFRSIQTFKNIRINKWTNLINCIATGHSIFCGVQIDQIEMKNTQLWNCTCGSFRSLQRMKEHKNFYQFKKPSTSPFSAWTGKMLRGNQKLHLLWNKEGTFCWWMSGFSLWKVSKLWLLTTQLHCNTPILPE